MERECEKTTDKGGAMGAMEPLEALLWTWLLLDRTQAPAPPLLLKVPMGFRHAERQFLA